MRIFLFRLRYLLTVTVLTVQALFAEAAPVYTIVDIGDLGAGTRVWPSDINANGQVVGQVFPGGGGGGTTRAFLYSDGVMTQIAGLRSAARAINDSGHVTGDIFDDSGAHAYIYRDGHLTFIGGRLAYGINASGQATGSMDVPGVGSQAFFYSKGKMTPLGTLGGHASTGMSINASGQITGFAYTAGGKPHAFLYSGGAMVDIGTLPGFNECQGYSINDSGLITGYCRSATEAIMIRAFLYSGGALSDLATLGGKSSLGRAINSAGQITGGAQDSGGAFRAFLYSGGTMIRLDTLLPPGSGWSYLYEGWAINDVGQIAGTGFRNGVERAFLLTPPPAGIALSTTGLTLTEGGIPGTYAVTLTSVPSATVTVTIASSPQLTVSPAKLSFNASNWNVPQIVTVQAIQDGMSEGAHSTVIHHSASSADVRYNEATLDQVNVAIDDNVPPVIQVEVPVGGVWIQPDLPVSGTAQPGATLVLNIANLSTNAFGNQSVTVGADGNWSMLLTGLSDGVYELEPEVGGVKGNKVSIAVDSHAPVSTLSVTSASNPTNGWYAGPVTMKVTANDGAGGQGVDRSEFTLDGGAWSAVPAGGVVLNVNGSHDFCYRSVDSAGNTETARCTNVKIDAAAPLVNPVFDAASNLLHLNVQDALSGVASIEISRDGGQTWVAQSGPVGFTQDGSHVVQYRVRDQAGNLTAGQVTVTVVTVPVVSAPAPQTAFEAASQGFDLGAFTDQAADSPWNVDVDWGDGSAHDIFTRTAPGALGSQPHTYADNGTYAVTVRVTDFAGNIGSASFSVVVANVAPTATFAATSGPLNEGESATLTFGNPVDPSPVDTQAGFQYAFDCGDGNGFRPASTAANMTCLALDNPNQTVRGRVIDKDGGATEYSAVVAINNLPPVLGAISGPASQVVRNTPATITASFTDPGVRDTHTVMIDWDDGTGSAGTVTEESGSGSISASHSYTRPGRYIVTMTLTDKDGASATATYTAIQIRGGPPER